MTNQFLTREWKRDDGAVVRIDRCLVDANWGASTDVVYQFCRQSPHAVVLLPSHGRYVGASSIPFSEYKRRPGDRVGHNWRIPSVQGKRAIRHVLFDTNYWKTFVHARLAVRMGDKGCLWLFGRRPDEHRLFAEHLTAEYRVWTEGRGREVDEWKLRPDRSDNHWLDCLVGSAVAASMEGATLAGMMPAKRPRRWISLSAIQAERRRRMIRRRLYPPRPRCPERGTFSSPGTALGSKDRVATDVAPVPVRGVRWIMLQQSRRSVQP